MAIQQSSILRCKKLLVSLGINFSGIRRHCQLGTDCDLLAKFSIIARRQKRLNQHRK